MRPGANHLLEPTAAEGHIRQASNEGGRVVARRRAPARSTKPRTRQLAAVLPVSRAGRVGANGQPTREQAESADAAEAEALVATHWFDSGEEGEPYAATVRFTGRRVGTRGNPRPRDTFEQEETIEGIVPGTGPVSITTWVYRLRPGEWTVTGELIRIPSGAGGPASAARSRLGGGRPVRPAAWSWRRWAVSTGSVAPVKTRWALLAPLARQPAVLPGIYTALAVVGAVVALAVQAAILARGDVAVSQSLAASVLALVSGLIGAKLWYAVLHPDESIIKGGWAVDGFLVVAPVVAAVTLLAFDLPIGIVLDATAPGLFFAVAVGRVGCFFTGCCAGRCTASRWGIWSSDRRVGARRIPAQLLESAAGLVIGVATLLLLLGNASPVPGAIFVSAFAAYALVRQFLLRLRSEQRKSYRTLPLTAAAAVLVVVAITTLSLLQET